jgi:hypothetical protein
VAGAWLDVSVGFEGFHLVEHVAALCYPCEVEARAWQSKWGDGRGFPDSRRNVGYKEPVLSAPDVLLDLLSYTSGDILQLLLTLFFRLIGPCPVVRVWKTQVLACWAALAWAWSSFAWCGRWFWVSFLVTRGSYLVPLA